LTKITKKVKFRKGGNDEQTPEGEGMRQTPKRKGPIGVAYVGKQRYLSKKEAQRTKGGDDYVSRSWKKKTLRKARRSYESLG